MTEPNISIDGHCPGCAGTEWKLASLLVLQGLSNISGTANGGGFGVGGGLGRGHGGIGVNYQGVNLSIDATNISAIAERLSPPTVPNEYDKKDSLISECNDRIDTAARAIENIDGFALMSESNLKPGVFSKGLNAVDLEVCDDKYVKCRSRLETILSFERAKALWDKTRVCSRCGEGFITTEDEMAITPSFSIPEFSFEGKNRHCLNCGCYQWKRADSYYTIKIRMLEEELKMQEDWRKNSIEHADNANEGGLWKKLKNILTIVPLDTAKKLVEETNAKLSKLVEDRKSTEQKYSSLEKVRVCSDCESSYAIDAPS